MAASWHIKFITALGWHHRVAEPLGSGDIDFPLCEQTVHLLRHKPRFTAATFSVTFWAFSSLKAIPLSAYVVRENTGGPSHPLMK